MNAPVPSFGSGADLVIVFPVENFGHFKDMVLFRSADGQRGGALNRL